MQCWSQYFSLWLIKMSFLLLIKFISCCCICIAYHFPFKPNPFRFRCLHNLEQNASMHEYYSQKIVLSIFSSEVSNWKDCQGLAMWTLCMYCQAKPIQCSRCLVIKNLVPGHKMRITTILYSLTLIFSFQLMIMLIITSKVWLKCAEMILPVCRGEGAQW